MNAIKSNKSDRNVMKNDEWFQYFTEVKALIDRHGATTLRIETQYQTLQQAYDLADEALRNIAKSALTEEVKALDRRRDTALAGINETTRTAQRHFRQEVQQAARRLKIALDVYKHIAKLPLHEQTSAVYNLLQELRGRFADDVQHIGLNEWVDELEIANNALTKMMRERRDESLAAKPETSMKKARKMLDDAMNVITQRINALILIEGETGFIEFVNAINQLIDNFHALLNQRIGRRKKMS